MTTAGQEVLPFPGAVGLTHLRVYDTAAPDGTVGGSPHVHLASAEAYIPISGEGEVRTLGAEGERVFPLRPGGIVWFEPGVIHRLVNADRLELLVVMQNAGLPEAGDAVFTFPEPVMADPEAYARAAALPQAPHDERVEAAGRRRDLAVEGFDTLLAASAGGDAEPYRRFLYQAVAVKGDRLAGWAELVRSGPVAEARRTEERLAALKRGNADDLFSGRVREGGADGDAPQVGMCGLLRGFDRRRA